MRLHLLSLPHTQLTPRYLSCAYSQKIVKFCKMMGNGPGGQGSHEIILYAGEQVEVRGISEHVVCITEAERYGWFGDGFNTVTTPLSWDPTKPYWMRFAERAIPELRARGRSRDLLLVIAGCCQKPIADAVGETLMPIEWGVGYEGTFANFCAFESAAWMHHVYGLKKIVNGRAFDQVIPNYFDPDDFDPVAEPMPYLLFLGRVTQRKGPHVAGQIAKRLGMKLLVAGPGGTQDALGPVRGDQCSIEGEVRYVGEVGKERRAELLAHAACLIVPTLYVEPFGGVAVEAMMAGCPVAASDWGAFCETVTPDVGRRFRTLRQGADAVREAMTLDRHAIAAAARQRFSLDAVRPKFDAWFAQLGSLWGEGWAA